MSPFIRASQSSRSLARQSRNAARPIDESFLDMTSDYGSDGYSYQAGVETPTTGQRVRSFLTPLGAKLKFPSSPSSPTSPNPTGQVGQLIDDSLRPIRDVKDKIVDSYRQYEARRLRERNARRQRQAYEEAELRRAREMINQPCPIQQAKKDREHERIGRERRAQVEVFKKKAEKRERDEEKSEARRRRDMARVTIDKCMSRDDCQPPPLPMDFEKTGWAFDPELGMREFRLSRII